MSSIGNIDLKKRWGRDWIVLILSLLLAFFAWFVHNISQKYSVYIQYRVFVSTNIEGRMPTSVSNETLLLKGYARGVYILRNGNGRDESAELTLELPAEVFTPSEEIPTRYTLQVASIRDKIIEELGEEFDLDYIETSTLTFDFPYQSFKRVPVLPKTDISFREQYMQMGDVEVSPDSVNIYGNKQIVDNINFISTKMISLNHVDKSVKGAVMLEPIQEVRVDQQRALYSVSVERYVENSINVKIDVTNLPADKSVILLPSRAVVTYRTPFKSRNEDYSSRMSFVIDYNDIAKSRSSKVVPKLKNEVPALLSYNIEPSLVECIITDNK